MAKDVKTAEAEVKEKVADAQSIINQINEGLKNFQNLTDAERQIMIDDYNFNPKNKGISHLTTERATEEYMLQAKKDFEDYQSEYLKLSYEICDKTKSLEYANFLEEWNHKYVILPANYWVGCLTFKDVIEEIVKKVKENPDEDLSFDYGALTYTYNLMMQPCGIGFEYANWMGKNQEVYNAILNKLADHVHTVDLIHKKIGLLQVKWAMACQGFVTEFDIDIKDLKSMENMTVNGVEEADENSEETDTVTE